MEEIVCGASDDRQCVRGSFYMNWSQAGCVAQKLSEDILPGIHELRVVERIITVLVVFLL